MSKKLKWSTIINPPICLQDIITMATQFLVQSGQAELFGGNLMMLYWPQESLATSLNEHLNVPG